LGGKGLFLKHNEKNKNNIYLRTIYPYISGLIDILKETPITICGEVFGNGVQDLKYGMKPGEVGIRVFDVYIGNRGMGWWLSDTDLDTFCEIVGMQRVPILYRGPYSKEKMAELSQHKYSTFDDKQIIEGIVTAAVPDRTAHGLGRVKLKFINESYYLRKNGTEFN